MNKLLLSGALFLSASFTHGGELTALQLSNVLRSLVNQYGDHPIRYFSALDSDVHAFYSVSGVATNFQEGCFTLWCAFPAHKVISSRQPGDHE